MSGFASRQAGASELRWATAAIVRRALRALAVLVLLCTGGMLAIPWSAYAAATPAVATSSVAAPASLSGAKSASNAPPPESPASTAATPAEGASASSPGPATSSAASAARVPPSTSSASPTSSASASTSATPPAAPVTARQPARTASPAVTDNRPPPYTPPQQQLRFGSYAVFRNLIPSPQLEAQAADEFQQIVYGAQHAERLYPDTDARVIRVQTILDKLIPYSLKWNERAKNWKWQIAVVRSPDIRMYCLPGGKIAIYSGILDRVHLNDNELGMLLGHEIAHALREHARERLGEQQASQLDSSGTIPQLFGLADLGAPVLGIGSQLVEMKYTPTDETEADVIGSDIASRAGYDPRAAITLWDKLAVATHSSRNQGYIYVHPYTPARRADLVKRLPDMLQLYAKAIGKTVDELPDYAGIGRPRRLPVRGD